MELSAEIYRSEMEPLAHGMRMVNLRKNTSLSTASWWERGENGTTTGFSPRRSRTSRGVYTEPSGNGTPKATCLEAERGAMAELLRATAHLLQIDPGLTAKVVQAYRTAGFSEELIARHFGGDSQDPEAEEA